MKKISLLFAAVFMIMLFSFPASAESGTCGENIRWDFEKSTGTLTISGKGDMEEFPDDAPWSDYVNHIKKVVVTEGVTSISEYAFMWCVNLETIDIPDSITEMVNWFGYCYSIRNMTISESIESIEEGAFSGCPCIERFEVDKNNKNYSNDSSGVLFDKNKTVLIGYPIRNGKNSYVVPDSVERIGDYAFVDANTLKNVVIGEKVKAIGEGAFRYSGLESVYIPDGVTEIGQGCFLECKSLQSIRIPGSVKVIDIQVCLGCDNLEEVILGEGIETICWNSFENTKTKEIIIPSSVTMIEGRSFAFTDNLKEFKIAKGNKNYKVIDGCIYDITGKKLVAVPSGKETLILPSDLITVETGACVGNSFIKSIEIPKSVTRIGDSAFMYCDSLSKIVVKSPKTKVGVWAFSCMNIFTGDDNSNREIYAYINSPAHQYAVDNGFKFIDIKTVQTENDNTTAILGDVDGDNKVSVMDATEIQRHIAKLTTLSENRLACADTDKDGKVTVLDATQIQLFIAQLVPEL